MASADSFALHDPERQTRDPCTSSCGSESAATSDAAAGSENSANRDLAESRSDDGKSVARWT